MFNKHAKEPESGRVRRIVALLEKRYRLAETALNFKDPFQLFVAVVLSARTTDEQVNRTTAKLFLDIGTPQEMAQMRPAELERYLKGCGLFRQKSRYLIEASRIIMEKHGGELPDTFEELVALPGAGPKTANVILNSAFGQPALAVDTHVYRVSRRLGLATSDRADRVEEELKALIPREKWGALHHRLIAHGRRVCQARKPGCGECILYQLCPSKVIYIKGKPEEGSDDLGKI